MNIKNQNLLDVAKKYLAMGFSVIPTNEKKTPIIQWSEYQKRLPTIKELEQWFSGNTAKGIAIVTGSVSGIVVLDTEKGADFANIKIPQTPTAISGGGGVHYYFKPPKGKIIKNAVHIAPLMDIRGEGGCIIAPPSLHPSGNNYKWADGLEIGKVELAPMPKWLNELIKKKQEMKKETSDWGNVLEGTSEGSRNDTAASLAGKLLSTFAKEDWSGLVWPMMKNWNDKNKPPLDEKELRSVFDSISEMVNENPKDAEEKTKAKKLIEITREEGIKLFCDQFKKPFALVRFNETEEVVRLGSKDFRNWLAHIAWQKRNMTVADSTIKMVINMLGGQAQFLGESHQLFVRTAWHEGKIWYDLGDGQAVLISQDGWKIVEHPPILFYKFNHQHTQVHPEKGGSLNDILPFFNLKDNEEQLLLKVVIVSSFIPGFPHPISVVYGPQGSAKSTFHKILKKLIDPSAIETIAPPTNIRELVQIASHHWALFFDNLSNIQDWFSDALCRMCTGDGFSKRELFTDDDDIIYSFRLVMGFNGINIAGSKPDLLNRCILLALEPISDTERKQEKDVLDGLEKIRPQILGAIFDLAAKAMKERPNVKIDKLPRMADFAYWGCAITKAMGINQEDFIRVLEANVVKQHNEAIEANPVAMAITDFMKNRDSWEGAPTQLLEILRSTAILLKIDTQEKSWPKSPVMLWRKIMIVKIDLEANGIKVDKNKSGNRTISLWKIKE